MADTIWLECGEDGSDRLDLMSAFGGGPGILVLAGGPDIVDDAESDEWQIVTLPLLFRGSSKNELIAFRRAVTTKLNQARAGVQPGSGLPMVNVAIRLDGANELVRWYVADGELDRGGWDGIASNVIGHNGEAATLTLRVYRGGLGELIEYGPFDVGGDELTFHVNGIPGDLPALAEMVIEDDSTGGVAINRLRIASRSLPDMDEGDFGAIVPFVETGDGDPDGDTFTGWSVDGTAVSEWQTIGSATNDAAYGGVFDVFARMRDATLLSHPPANVNAVGAASLSEVQSVISNGSSGASRTIAWPSPTTDGNTLILVVNTRNPATEITPPAGWSTAIASAGTNAGLAIYYKANAPSESGPIGNVLFSPGTAISYLTLIEVRGIVASSPVDQTSAATNTSSSTGDTGTTGATTQDYAYALAAFSLIPVGSNTNANTPSVPTNYTGLYGGYGYRIASRILTSTGTQNATASAGVSTDWRSGLVVFKAAALAPADLPVDNYLVCVTAFDADSNETAPSSIVSVTLAAVGAIFVTWDGVAGATDYRVYVKQGTNPWGYYDTGSTATSFSVEDSTPDGTGNPPSGATGIGGEFRFFFGRENSVMQQPPIGPIHVAIGNDTWEWVYLRRMHLPPSSTPFTGSAPGWAVAVQGRAIAPTNLGIDALALLPADEGHIVDAAYVPNNLSTPRDWRIWTTVTGHSNGYLSDGGDEAGNLRVRGRLMLGPGDTTVVMLPDIAGGISRIEDVAMSVTVRLRARYLWLAGES